MDNQSGQGGGTWGRPEPKIGAIVDDNTKTVFAKGLGWVNGRGDVWSGGQWFPVDQHAGPARDQAMQWAAKAKSLFDAGPAQPPVVDQMRSVQKQAAAPKPLAPSLPANPTHTALVSSFKHLANKLTQGGAPQGGL